MGWALSIAVGGALVLGVLWDALTTTVNVSERIGHIARGVFAVTNRPLDVVMLQGARPTAALVQVVLLILSWTMLLWAGWWLVLLGDPIQFVYGVTGQGAGAMDTLYIAGFGVFALGVGDFGPTTSAAQLLLPASSVTGLFLVTLEVTYLLSLTRAVTHKRHLARLVRSLGNGCEEIVERAWDGTSFAAAAAPLQTLASDLTLLAEHQVTFPVLHKFGTHRPDLILAARLVDLLDAIHLMSSAPVGTRLPDLTSHQLRTGMHELVRATPLHASSVELSPEPGPDVLERLAIDTTGSQEPHLDAGLRSGLHALADLEGWPKGPQ